MATPYHDDALMRPGMDVRLVNISRHGALVDAASRMHPGRGTELHLSNVASGSRLIVRGRIERCAVVALDPLLYRGAVAFDRRLDP
jgi:hypothetical protein